MAEVGAVTLLLPRLSRRLVAWGTRGEPVGPEFEGIRGALSSAMLETLLAWAIFLLVLGAGIRYRPLRQALSSLRERPRSAGWRFAGITAFCQALALILFFIGDRGLLWEASWFNAYMSAGTALGGGLAEEVVYRGVVVLRLRAAGVSAAGQVLASGVLFGFAHASWSASKMGSGVVAILMPVVGTAVLGALFARAYQLSGYRLLPVVVAHAALNLIVEPALMLSYFGP